jgi:cytidylate kinase
MTDYVTVAIDGPSGSGKSTAAKAVAERLGYHYLDTGAMYRAVAVGCLRSGVDRTDAAAVTDYCRRMDLAMSTDPSDSWVRLDGRDITADIRLPEVSAWVSVVATNPDCRAELVRRQQALLATANFVAEGRDITTVVAPQAPVRILLQADPAVRLARRGAELGNRVTAAELSDQVLRRDRDDSTLVNFVEAAPGVTVIDSTNLTPSEVVDRIVTLVEAAGFSVAG